MSESSLAGFLSKPCEATFGPIFDELYPRLYRYFAVRGLAAESAAELSSDVLWATFRNVSNLRQADSFFGWLYQIARSHLLQFRRRHFGELIIAGSFDTISVFTPSPRQTHFYDWIHCLAEDEREICVLCYVDGLDHPTIAEVLDIPVGVVLWKIEQAHARTPQQHPKHAGGRR